MSRRKLLSSSLPASSGGNLFPLHFNLTKISDEEYRMDPTPESIAFADYFMENAVWDGASTWSLILKPGMVYIDGVEIEWIDKVGGANGVGTYASWAPSYDYDVGRFEAKEFITYDGQYLPKGTFNVCNDD